MEGPLERNDQVGGRNDLDEQLDSVDGMEN